MTAEILIYRVVGIGGALQVDMIDGPVPSANMVHARDELPLRAIGTATPPDAGTSVPSAPSRGLVDRVGFAYHGSTQSRRLQQLTNLGPGPSMLSQFTYPLYNAEGDILSWSQTPGGGSADPIGYDDARQLTSFGQTVFGTSKYLYGYDDAGNRVSELTPSGVRTSTYDTTNALTGYVDPTQTRVVTRDLNGNIVSEGTLRSYEWDVEDRLTKITQGSRVSTFTYDGLGRRVRIVEAETAGIPGTLSDRGYIWCGIQPCEERDGVAPATVTRRFLDHGFQVGTTKYFYTRDHLGSVREVMNATGSAVTRYAYDPWGRQSKLFGVVEAPVGYAGYWTQANGGLNLTWYRAYSADLGRWLSRDPIGELANGMGGATDLSLYAYVGNNSPGFTDPAGLAGLENETMGSIAVIPEDAPARVDFCPPLSSCNIDAYFPGPCSEPPVKVVDGCTAIVSPTGHVSLACPMYNPAATGKRRWPLLGQIRIGGSVSAADREKWKWPGPEQLPHCASGSCAQSNLGRHSPD